ncbi:conserved Plasmodium protein, unknown function [Plasmodium relictum]|uniref:EGF-like domain-containing protein n=1 Tax=Plasmodium relictum TaxID=85471 RepID=A0A1J1HFD9_PLARL|nr:conserved Plasmodium protein, unknown function [Plasmodium relictum]CRH04104.1 conserved Plasmodium protein, unknown function [Plasmodium relictum]
MLNFKLINFLIVYIFYVRIYQSLNEIIDAQKELDNFYLCDYKCDEGEICIYTNKQNNVYKCIKKEENEVALRIGKNNSAKKKNSDKDKNEKNREIYNMDRIKIPKSFLCNSEESKKCKNQVCLKNKNKAMCLCPSGKKFMNNECKDIIVLNKKCPEHLCDSNATCFLNETKMKFKCICNDGYWGFGNVCFPLKNLLSNKGKIYKNKKKRNDKNSFPKNKKYKEKRKKSDETENKKKEGERKEKKEKLENIGTTNDSFHLDKNAKIQNYSRKGRILNDAGCKLDCGEHGKCVKENNYEYCVCNPGYSSNIENNFKCEEHCKVNNGGCDPNASCEPVEPADEEKNNVIKGVGVICKCKNEDTKYNGYYCSSSYLISFNFFFLILFFLYLFH